MSAPDGTRQRHALAFQGNVVTSTGATISEVFVVDIPDDVAVAGDIPLEGTATTRPAPPRGTQQRRLTFTADRKYPGLQGPRHWLRSSPDGTQIAFLMRDDAGIVQLWTISPNGGEPHQLTHNPFNIASAFSWSPDGRSIAYVADNSIFVTDVLKRQSPLGSRRAARFHRTAPRSMRLLTRRQIASLTCGRVQQDRMVYNQIYVVER